jgi:hypothetical protein
VIRRRTRAAERAALFNLIERARVRPYRQHQLRVVPFRSSLRT